MARPHQSVGFPNPSLLVRALLIHFFFNSYISYRQSYAHHPKKRIKYGPGITTNNTLGDNFPGTSYSSEDRRGLLSAGAFEDDGDAVIEMDLLPPRWADIGDDITEILASVAKKSQHLERLHQKHILPAFNDDETKKAEEGEIERLTQEITKGFHQCHNLIQRVEQMVRESKQQGTLTRAEEMMAKNIQISLATRVQEASAGFRKKQSAYLKSIILPFRFSIWFHDKINLTLLNRASWYQWHGVTGPFRSRINAPVLISL